MLAPYFMRSVRLWWVHIVPSISCTLLAWPKKTKIIQFLHGKGCATLQTERYLAGGDHSHDLSHVAGQRLFAPTCARSLTPTAGAVIGPEPSEANRKEGPNMCLYVQHVLLALGGGDGEGLVEVGRGGDVDSVHLGVLQKLFVSAVGPRNALFLGPLCSET
jgi:hypothetical protein